MSGTQSAYIPTYSTKRWFDEIKMNMKYPSTRMWEPWFYQKKINGGEIEEIPGMTLLTIRAAGFYMFEDQPELAWHIYDSFVKGTKI